MILYEFEVRRLLELAGVKLEEACLASNMEEVEECVSTIEPPYVVKAQVRGWGRGKAGLIGVAKTREEAAGLASKIFSRSYGGSPIRYVLISRYVPHTAEYYLSFMLDGVSRSILLLVSRSGGVDVEEAGEVLKIRISPLIGLQDYMCRLVAGYLDAPVGIVSDFIRKIYGVFTGYKLHLLELNPLVISDGMLLPLDRKAVADDDAVLGSEVLKEFWMRYTEELPPVQRRAVDLGINLVVLDGNIGVIGNGAGLTMATMDLVDELGGKAGVFLDVGGGASAERVRISLELVANLQSIRSIAVNILGGITRCDEVARGIVEASVSRPRLRGMLHVRMAGLNEEEGRRILREAGIRVYDNPVDAVREAVLHARAG